MAEKESKEFKLLGYSINKVIAEKKQDFSGKIPDITSNIDIKSIEKHKIDLFKEETLKIDFSFSLSYGDLGNIEMLGSLVIILDEKTKKQVLEEWKDKKLPSDLRLILLNIVIQKSSLRALQLEEELGLPFHIQLPRIQFQSKDQAKSE